MSNFQEMTVAQLKQFLSDHRSNDEMLSDALGELLRRNPDRPTYSADMPPEEIGELIRKKIEQIRNKEQYS